MFDEQHEFERAAMSRQDLIATVNIFVHLSKYEIDEIEMTCIMSQISTAKEKLYSLACQIISKRG